MSSTSSLSRLQELLPELFQSPETRANAQKNLGDRYLRFSLNSELSALILMDNIQESLVISGEKITPIPVVASSVMGLMSSRDAVFCVFDLGELIGLPPLSTYLRQYHIVVLKAPASVPQSSELLVGVAVHQIQGVTRVLLEKIDNSSEIFSQFTRNNFPHTLKKYFRGGFKEKEKELLILDIETLFSYFDK